MSAEKKWAGFMIRYHKEEMLIKRAIKAPVDFLNDKQLGRVRWKLTLENAIVWTLLQD